NDQESVASSPSGPWTSYFYVDEVSVTDMGACCDNTLVIEDGWNVDDVLNDPSFAPFINGSTLNSVAQVKVEGNFTINKDFTIESTHFVMDAGAGINVSTGQTLTIDNSILDVCGNTMWNGISVNGTSAEVIVSGSEIWEAVKGIHSLNGGK